MKWQLFLLFCIQFDVHSVYSQVGADRDSELVVGRMSVSVRKVVNSKYSHRLLQKLTFASEKLDPDVKRNLTELISSEGYPVERYTVQTADGFLLDLHRIPHGRNGTFRNSSKPAVLLQHGLLSTACDWVMNFPRDSLGFILADAGYDVWMSNSRGNTYSRRHISLSPEDDKFWDWSFDEMAFYDLPAFIDFILSKTGQSSLFYAGHSQGTTMAFALFSQRPDIAKKIRLFVPLAPVAELNYIQSPIKDLSVFSDKLLYEVFGHKDFLPSSFILRWLVDITCTDPVTKWICDDIVFVMAGPDITNFNQTRLDVYLNHTPAGASTKDLIHFAQVYRQKKFQKYDYGSPSENMKHYNQTTPPVYDVSKVQVPIVAFLGTNDWLADMKDAGALLAKLPNVKEHYVLQGWNHLDFIWGKDAGHLCYTHIVQWMQKF